MHIDRRSQHMVRVSNVVQCCGSLSPPLFFFAVPHLSDGVRHARPQNGAEPAGDGEHGIVHMQDGSLLPVLRDLENEVSEIRVKLDLAPVSLPFYTTVPFRYQSV
jgi:hypothetical protein